MPAPPQEKKIIGLVGGIGSGKSTVARVLVSLGCGLIDADDLSHRALDEPEVRQKLVEWWGPSVVDKDGTINRKAVGERVFADPAELKRLEELIHPRVIQERAALLAKYRADPGVTAIVDDTPLLMETGLDEDCDAIIFIEASWENRVRRVAAARGWTADELTRRQENQMPLDMKAKRADYVVENNASGADCESHVRRVLSQILNDRPA